MGTYEYLPDVYNQLALVSLRREWWAGLSVLLSFTLFDFCFFIGAPNSMHGCDWRPGNIDAWRACLSLHDRVYRSPARVSKLGQNMKAMLTYREKSLCVGSVAGGKGTWLPGCSLCSLPSCLSVSMSVPASCSPSVPHWCCSSSLIAISGHVKIMSGQVLNRIGK